MREEKNEMRRANDAASCQTKRPGDRPDLFEYDRDAASDVLLLRGQVRDAAELLAVKIAVRVRVNE